MSTATQETIPNRYHEQNFLEYAVISPLSEQTRQGLVALQEGLVSQFGDTIQPTDPEILHVTLGVFMSEFDIEDPTQKDEEFEQAYPDIDATLEAAVQNVSPIAVHFTELQVSENAIIVKGYEEGFTYTDNPKYTCVRNRLGAVSISGHEPKLPSIVHTTIARYGKAVDLTQIAEYASQQAVDLREIVDRFGLYRIDGLAPENFELITDYNLRP